MNRVSIHLIFKYIKITSFYKTIKKLFRRNSDVGNCVASYPVREEKEEKKTEIVDVVPTNNQMLSKKISPFFNRKMLTSKFQPHINISVFFNLFCFVAPLISLKSFGDTLTWLKIIVFCIICGIT